METSFGKFDKEEDSLLLSPESGKVESFLLFCESPVTSLAWHTAAQQVKIKKKVVFSMLNRILLQLKEPFRPFIVGNFSRMLIGS